MEKKKTWPVGTGGRIGWLKAFLVSYLISLLLLLLLSFFLWKFSWSESRVQAGIVVIYLTSSFCGGKIAGKQAEKRRFFWGICFGILYFAILLFISAVFLPGSFAGAVHLLWAAAVCAVGGMAGGMTAAHT
ncbi:TIGR04086 family membrane protein [Fusicatenibacter sp.]